MSVLSTTTIYLDDLSFEVRLDLAPLADSPVSFLLRGKIKQNIVDLSFKLYLFIRFSLFTWSLPSSTALAKSNQSVTSLCE